MWTNFPVEHTLLDDCLIALMVVSMQNACCFGTHGDMMGETMDTTSEAMGHNARQETDKDKRKCTIFET